MKTGYFEVLEKYKPCFLVVCMMHDRVYISILDDSAHSFEFVTMLAYAVLLYIATTYFSCLVKKSFT